MFITLLWSVAPSLILQLGVVLKAYELWIQFRVQDDKQNMWKNNTPTRTHAHVNIFGFYTREGVLRYIYIYIYVSIYTCTYISRWTGSFHPIRTEATKHAGNACSSYNMVTNTWAASTTKLESLLNCLLKTRHFVKTKLYNTSIPSLEDECLLIMSVITPCQLNSWWQTHFPLEA